MSFYEQLKARKSNNGGQSGGDSVPVYGIDKVVAVSSGGKSPIIIASAEEESK